MVVIEPVEPVLIREEENKNEKSPETKPPAGEETSSSTATRTVEDSSNGGDNNTAGYASDGFETASEGDLNDDDGVVVVEEGKVVEEEKREQNQDSNKNAEGNEGDQVGPATAEDRGKDEQEEETDENALTEANNAKLEGNTLFKDGLYEEALSKYEIALQAVSSLTSSVELRSICHANRAACYSKLEKFEDTIKECTKALELNPKYLKVLLRRAEAHEKLEHFEEAIADMTKVLEIDPSNDQARRNILRLKPLADEKREKMKEEMIGKLKEMGNSVLGRFGMSVDNFKAVKDPNTGSYSISFQR